MTDYTNSMVTVAGNVVSMAAAVELMDDDIREELARELSPCTYQEFCAAYSAAHLAKYGEIFRVM
nr:MAG TPA: hypothetical protein [Caudoviricetes sp.]